MNVCIHGHESPMTFRLYFSMTYVHVQEAVAEGFIYKLKFYPVNGCALLNLLNPIIVILLLQSKTDRKRRF